MARNPKYSKGFKELLEVDVEMTEIAVRLEIRGSEKFPLRKRR